MATNGSHRIEDLARRTLRERTLFEIAQPTNAAVQFLILPTLAKMRSANVKRLVIEIAEDGAAVFMMDPLSPQQPGGSART